MPYLNLIEHRNGGLDATPNKILWIDMVVKEIAGEYELQLPEEIPIVSMVPYLRQVYLTIQIKEIESNKGTYWFIKALTHEAIFTCNFYTSNQHNDNACTGPLW